MTLFHREPGLTVCCGDVREFAWEGEPFHALLADPPYELNFMGHGWDRSGVAFDPDTWRGLLGFLHPGAFGMAYASTRGYHRMACAIEDAGAVIQPMLVMAFATGFPKATKVDLAVDRKAGAEREVVGTKTKTPSAAMCHEGWQRPWAFNEDGTVNRTMTLTAPATDLAKTWAGHCYGGQAIKPALEPVAVFRLPYCGRPVDSITRTGAGALNVDAGRVGSDTVETRGRVSTLHRESQSLGPGWSGDFDPTPREGRWPAGLALCHAPECVPGACIEGCPVRVLGEQSGERSGSPESGSRGDATEYPIFGAGFRTAGEEFHGYGDSGTAARFYHQADWQDETAERLDEAVPFHYAAKAGRAERDAGLGTFPARTGAELCDREPGSAGLDNPGAGPGRASHIRNRMRCRQCGGWQNVGGQSIANRPKSTCACETPDYEPQPDHILGARNPHPTVKPLSMDRWLASLLLPPAAYAPRRLLVPFAGVGSEAIAAMQAGWEEIVCIEASEEYCEMLVARFRYWRERGLREALLGERAAAKAEATQAAGQSSLFSEVTP